MSVKQKQKQPNHWISCGALTLQAEQQEGHPAKKNPVVVPVSLSFVRARLTRVMLDQSAIKRLLILSLFQCPATTTPHITAV